MGKNTKIRGKKGKRRQRLLSIYPCKNKQHGSMKIQCEKMAKAKEETEETIGMCIYTQIDERR